MRYPPLKPRGGGGVQLFPRALPASVQLHLHARQRCRIRVGKLPRHTMYESQNVIPPPLGFHTATPSTRLDPNGPHTCICKEGMHTQAEALHEDALSLERAHSNSVQQQPQAARSRSYSGSSSPSS